MGVGVTINHGEERSRLEPLSYYEGTGIVWSWHTRV